MKLWMVFLIILTGCSSKIIEYRYIEPIIPEEPVRLQYFDVRWEKVGDKYCVDRDNALNLLHNRAIDELYIQEMREILRSLRSGRELRQD